MTDQNSSAATNSSPQQTDDALQNENEEALLENETNEIQTLEQKLSDAQDQLEKLNIELKQSREKELRAIADLQNVRRRMEEERGKLMFESTKGILLAILPSLDNFDRAIKNLPEELSTHEWVKGMLATEKFMYDSLRKEGLEQIPDPTGLSFDPEFHEAVMVDPNSGRGKVIQLVQKGYLFGGKVLRTAQVIVGDKSGGDEMSEKESKKDEDEKAETPQE